MGAELALLMLVCLGAGHIGSTPLYLGIVCSYSESLGGVWDSWPSVEPGGLGVAGEEVWLFWASLTGLQVNQRARSYGSSLQLTARSSRPGAVGLHHPGPMCLCLSGTPVVGFGYTQCTLGILWAPWELSSSLFLVDCGSPQQTSGRMLICPQPACGH